MREKIFLVLIGLRNTAVADLSVDVSLELRMTCGPKFIIRTCIDA